MKRFGIFLAAFLICGSMGKAQNFQMYNFGEYELSSYNPAALINEGSTVYGRGRYEWYNSDLYSEKPYNFAIGGNAVGNKWGGVSAQINYDEYSYFKRHTMMLNYAYRFSTGTNKDHHFAFGGGLALSYDLIDMGALKYDEGSLKGCSPDFNIGFEYNYGPMRVGLGGVNLLATSVKVNGAKVTRNPRVLLAYLIYRFDIQDVVGITPMVYAGYCEKTMVEISLRFDYKKIIELSYGFRAMDLRHIIVMNFNIPKSPVSLDLSLATAQFYYAQTLSAGIRVKL